MLEAAPELAAIHPMDAQAPDEEIMLLEHSFMSTVPECYAHIPEFGDWLYEQDQSAGYDYLYRCLQFLQWQKRRKGQTGTRWLLKTPHHLHYPEYLFKRLPIPIGHFESSVIKLRCTGVNKKHRMVINKFLTAIAACEGPKGLLLAFALHHDFVGDD